MLTPDAVADILERFGVRADYGHLWGAPLVERLVSDLRRTEAMLDEVRGERDRWVGRMLELESRLGMIRLAVDGGRHD